MKNKLLFVSILILQGCLQNPDVPAENISDAKKIIKKNILTYMMNSKYAVGARDLPVVEESRQQLEDLAGKSVAGLATADAIYIISGFSNNGFCIQLVHEYMHEYFYYSTGDPDSGHANKYEFFTLPSIVCNGVY